MLCAVLLAGCTTVATTPEVVLGDRGFHLAQIGSELGSTSHDLRIERTAEPPSNTTEWTVAAIDPASRTVRIQFFDSGGVECGLVDRAGVQETTSTVVIGLHERRTGTGACAGSAVAHTATIALHRPLGGRALVEQATGVNDGLPKVTDPTTLPVPRCAIEEGSASDVPVGLPSAATQLAPTAATKAFVCRTWWPKGSAHMESTTITDRATVAALAASVNEDTTGLRSASDASAPCSKRLPGSWYDVYFEGPGIRVEVKADEINCLTITNGAASGSITPALAETLDPLFSH